MPTLTLPLPPDALRPNERMGRGWQAVESAKRKYQEACQKEALIQEGAWRGVPVVWPVHLHIWIYLGKRQRCDTADAGAWVKSGLDALVQMGVFPEDNSSRFDPVTTYVRRDWLSPRVVLTWGDEALALPEGRMVLVKRTVRRAG